MNTITKGDIRSVDADCFSYDREHPFVSLVLKSNFSHKFGTYDSPSIEAKYIIDDAKNNNAVSQYILGVYLFGLAYKEPISEKLKGNFDSQIASKSEFWIARSAENGYLPAMIAALHDLLMKGHLDQQQIDRMKKYLLALEEGNYEKIDKLRKEVNKRVFLFNPLSAESLKFFDELTEKELIQIADGYISGLHLYSPTTLVEIDFNKLKRNIPQGKKLYVLAINKFESGEASYKLARAIKGKGSLYYYKLSAKYGYSKAMAWLGSFYFCSGADIMGKHWLEKAKKAKDIDAIDTLEEISDYGDIYDCSPYRHSYFFE
ncbi:hypothetical protein J7384_16740 [Endozoicomonas sp. G2_1]|uniref:hypothetical protein n=1 Tax=Endozoicomonas sp. G2_1 TaxID=2821091 RepID=UPI001ADCF0F6|nr:hypothetical protein [Endozoicomonas sp. G2_1]MBO9492010.1 hypothetical protein [Endozoicomonas sp. G2_1]